MNPPEPSEEPSGDLPPPPSEITHSESPPPPLPPPPSGLEGEEGGAPTEKEEELKSLQRRLLQLQRAEMTQQHHQNLRQSSEVGDPYFSDDSAIDGLEETIDTLTAPEQHPDSLLQESHHSASHQDPGKGGEEGLSQAAAAAGMPKEITAAQYAELLLKSGTLAPALKPEDEAPPTRQDRERRKVHGIPSLTRAVRPISETGFSVRLLGLRMADDNPSSQPPGLDMHPAAQRRMLQRVAPPSEKIRKMFQHTVQRRPLPMEGSTMVDDPHGDSVILFGGIDGKRAFGELWLFHKTAEEWGLLKEAKGDQPLPRCDHSAVVSGGRMIIYGGYGRVLRLEKTSTKLDTGLLSSVYSFDLETRLWSHITCRYKGSYVVPRRNQETEAEQIRFARIFAVKGHSAVTEDNCMYVFGGCTPIGRTNMVRVLRLDTYEWQDETGYNKQAIEDMVLMRMAMERQREFEIRQRELRKAAPPPDPDDSEADSDTVTTEDEEPPELPPPNRDVPLARSSHTCVLAKRCGCQCPELTFGPEGPEERSMLLFGGRITKYSYSNSIFAYGLKSKRWRRLPARGSCPPPRAGHTAHMYGHHMVVFGGYCYPERGYSKYFFADVHILNTHTLVWTAVTLNPIQAPREGPNWPDSKDWYMFGRTGHSAAICTVPDTQVVQLVVHGGWAQALPLAQPGREGEQQDLEDAVWDSCCIVDHTLSFLVAKPQPVLLSPRPPEAPPANPHRSPPRH